MTLRTVGGRQAAEDINDLVAWVARIAGCPSIDRTVVAACRPPTVRSVTLHLLASLGHRSAGGRS